MIRARLEPGAVGASLDGRRVLAFAGIGRPEKFFATLEALGARIVARRPFPDHYAFTRRELARLVAAAEADDLVPVTTEKDHVRIATSAALRDHAARIVAVPVRLRFEDDAVVRAMVQGLVERIPLSLDATLRRAADGWGGRHGGLE